MNRPWRVTLTAIFYLALYALTGCKLERPDPASAAAAILHKHPTDFLAALTALDALASSEAGLPKISWLDELYRQSALLKPLLKSAHSDSEKVAWLNAWVFDSLSIIPQADSLNLSFSLPSRVIKDHRGSCVGLTLYYLALSQNLDLPMFPVFLPGHIFIRFHSPTYRCNIETLRRGLNRSDEFYRQEFLLSQRPWYTLKDGEPKQALAALVFNLGNTHLANGKVQYARIEYQLTEEALPGFPEALSNQGALLLANGDIKEAEKKFRAALAGDSLNNPASRNLAKMAELSK